MVGYVFAILFTFFLTNISSFLYASPFTLPDFLFIIPQASLARIFYLLTSRCVESKCYESVSDIEGEMLKCFIYLYASAIFYFILGLFINEPKFKNFLYKLFKGKGNKNVYDQLPRSDPLTEKDQTAIDYVREVDEIDESDPNYVLVAKKLTKIFQTSKGKKVALRDFSLKLKKGQIFGLLGPNGAGKTTFLSIITGSLRMDQGSAYLGGVSVEERRSNIPIGFCPQFDILWPQMTVDEHLIFFSVFKRNSFLQSRRNAKKLIKKVDLQHDYKKKAQQLSGGMKRRCSLAMALVGNPGVVFLDEPSSGLDPVKRRHFWTLIKKVTASRAVLLTTHLMEEADTLCNEIGIITTGQLRCIGNSINLKQIFAEGMRIQLQVEDVKNEDMEDYDKNTGRRRRTSDLSMNERMVRYSTIATDRCREAFDALKQKIPQLTLESIVGKMLITKVDDKDLKLSTIFKIIKGLEMDQIHISDWSISLGSLEDVFLNVVRKYRGQNVYENL